MAQQPNSGMGTGTKIALGVAAAAGAAVIGAVGFGGGYAIYKTVKGKTQDASPCQLHIKVISGKNLENDDTFGKSDPYVVVEVDEVKKRTKTVDNNLNPEWNEELTIGILKDNMEDNINFGVFDDDHGGDENLGEAFIPVHGVPQGHPKRFDIGLKEGSIAVDMWLTGTPE